jgi:hypothetical protein
MFITALVILNLVALTLAWRDRSLGAMVIAVFIGPAANGVFALLALAMTPFLKRRRPCFSVWRHAALSLGIPVAAMVVDGILILLMRPSAC